MWYAMRGPRERRVDVTHFYSVRTLESKVLCMGIMRRSVLAPPLSAIKIDPGGPVSTNRPWGLIIIAYAMNRQAKTERNLGVFTLK